jgi:putative membrane protein
MTTDLVLAIAHHLLAFGLLAVMVMEFNMLRPGLSTSDLKRLGIVDAHYGALAMLLIVIGVCRVFFGIKGAAYYGDNPWFWAKMATSGGGGR